MSYYILHKDSKFVGISLEEPIPELISIGVLASGFDESVPDLNDVVWDAENLCLTSTGVYPKVDFLGLFTPQEEMSITASTEPLVQYTMRLFNAATVVSVHDPRTVQGLYILQAYGLLTQDRINTILGII